MQASPQASPPSPSGGTCSPPTSGRRRVAEAFHAEHPFAGAYEDGFVDLDGLRLHYTDWNPGGDRAVLLLHGLNVQAHTWDPAAAALAAGGRRVVCLDLRGHGESDWSREGYRVTDFAGDVLGLVDALGLDVVDVVGHSLGCRIGIVFAG